MTSHVDGGLLNPQNKDYDFDCNQSASELSSLMSPTSPWLGGLALTTPMACNTQQVSIHTGGVDLGTLLSQESFISSSLSHEDHIFADEEDRSNESPKPCTISDMNASRVSTILGVQKNDEDEETAALLATNPDDWSVLNQQRGREVAKVVLQRARTKTGSYMNSEKKSRAKHQERIVTENSFKHDLPTADKQQLNRQALNTHRTSTGSSNCSGSRSKRNVFSLCLKRFRRKRKAFLGAVFFWHAAKAKPSQVLNPIGSNGSTDTAESFDHNCDKQSPRSLYIEDDDEEVHGGDQNCNSDAAVQKKSEEEEQKKTEFNKNDQESEKTPKKSNRQEVSEELKSESKKKPKPAIKRFAPHSAKKIRSNVDHENSSDYNCVRKHRPSEVVESILCQFSDKGSHTSKLGVWSRRQQLQRPIESPSSSSSSEPDPTQKATSRDRKPEELLAEIRKMGKDGEKYSAILLRDHIAGKY